MKPPPDDELDDAAGDDREIVDTEGGCALPPIFCRDGEDAATTDEPIEYVYVFKKQPSKQMSFVDFRPVDQLQDLNNLLEQFGPGTYTLQGRAANRGRTLKQVAVVVGSEHGDGSPRGALEHVPRGGFDLDKLIATASPLVAIVTAIWDKREAARREEREAERIRQAEERRRDDERNERFMSLMTGLMKARNEDLETIVREKQQANAPSSARERTAFEDGLASALEMLKSAREEGLAGDDLETRLVGLAEAFVAGRKKGDDDIASVVANPNGAANS
jgi:hypothetical protein